jgi:hypothetical protein
MSDEGSSIFAGLISEEPKQLEPKEPDIVRRGPQLLVPPTNRKSAPSEMVVAWLVNHWPRNTITLRDFYSYAPNCARDPTNRASLIETLTAYGWLVPIEAWRRDQKKWRVVRGPSKEIQTQ